MSRQLFRPIHFKIRGHKDGRFQMVFKLAICPPPPKSRMPGCRFWESFRRSQPNGWLVASRTGDQTGFREKFFYSSNMLQEVIQGSISLPTMKATYHHLINRSRRVPLVLVVLVVSISLLSAVSADRPVHHEGPQKYFMASDGDLQSIAVRPTALSKEVKDNSTQHVFLSPPVTTGRSVLFVLRKVAFLFSLNPSHHSSLPVFLRVIRI